MAVQTSTVRTVPDWAIEYVTLYAERARALSVEGGTYERRSAASSTLVTGTAVNPTLAYDNNSITYADVLTNGFTNLNIVYSGFVAAVETYTSLKLNIKVALKQYNSLAMYRTFTISYSLNGGSTWTVIHYAYQINPRVYDPITESLFSAAWSDAGSGYYKSGPHTFITELPVGQDLTALQVKFESQCASDGGNTGFLIYEISTSGAYALPEGSPGGALQVYSGPIFAAQNQDEIDGIAGLATRGRYGDQVITKGIAYLDDVINSGQLAGTKAPFLAALASVTDNSTADWASVYSRIGRKAYYVGDTDSTYLAQRLTTTPRYGSTVDTIPEIYNARIEAKIYDDNFRKERSIQDHALGYGVEMGKHAAIDAETLRRAGLYQREYVQAGYVLSHKLFLEEQELAVVNLEIFGNCLRALTGSQQTTTETLAGANKITAAVGMGVVGGVAGWYIGSNLAAAGSTLGGPIGAAIGFAIGGIIGYLSA
jgi:hypothetical protein